MVNVKNLNDGVCADDAPWAKVGIHDSHHTELSLMPEIMLLLTILFYTYDNINNLPVTLTRGWPIHLT